MECEMCGAEIQRGHRILVEGAKLEVCGECARFGKLISEPRSVEQAGAKPKVEREIDVVAGYGDIIVKARRKMGIGRDVLAEMVNEKESFVGRVEEERALPTEALARRMERILGIKLMEEVVREQAQEKKEKKGSLTLGDVVAVKKRK